MAKKVSAIAEGMTAGFFDALDIASGFFPIIDEIPAILGPSILYIMTRDPMYIGGGAVDAVRALGAPLDELAEIVPTNLLIFGYRKLVKKK